MTGFDEAWLAQQLARRSKQQAEITARNVKPVKVKKPSKYHNVVTWVGAEKFDSAAEAERYKHLLLLVKGGQVRDLERQKSFDLIVNDILVCRYVADFYYFSVPHAAWITEDKKGKRTKEYIIKRKLMRACLGITVKEV